MAGQRDTGRPGEAAPPAEPEQPTLPQPAPPAESEQPTPPEAEPEQPTPPLPASESESESPTLPQPAPAAEPEQPTLPLSAPQAEPEQPTLPLSAPQAEPEQPTLPPEQRGRRLSPRLVRWGLVVLLALVILAGASGGALYNLSHAPEDAANQLCADALAGRYGAAYDLLGAALQAQVPHADIARIGQALDTLNGRVTSCSAADYAYALGSSRAALTARIVRAGGETFSGQVEMADEHGWKVVALAPSLTGASLGALDVALRFCDALRASDGGGLLGLSDASASAVLGDAQQLSANLSTWQQVDGPVTGCALAGTSATAASSSVAQLTLSVTRARRGTAVAALGLAHLAPGWRVTAIGADLLGSDLAPLALGQRFCAALAAGNYAGAYALFSPTYTAQVTLDQFTAAFAPLGGAWSCVPRLDTYAVSGASGSYDVALTLSGAGRPFMLVATLHFTLTGGVWAIQEVEPRGQ